MLNVKYIALHVCNVYVKTLKQKDKGQQEKVERLELNSIEKKNMNLRKVTLNF